MHTKETGGRAGLRKKLIGDKKFYKMVLTVTVPIMIQNGITNFVSLLDNIMVGQVGTEQMSGVAVANQLLFVFNICIFGAISGAGIFGAQFFGNGNYEGVRNAFRFKLMICAALVLLAIGIFLAGGEGLISLYLNEEGSAQDAARTLGYGKAYLMCMLAGLVPYALAQVYASTLREAGETVLPMKAGIAAVLVNLVLNYILIYGKFGAPEMGAEGAAIGTLAARILECAVLLCYIARKEDRLLLELKEYLHVDRVLAADYFRVCLPMLVVQGLWGLNTALQTVILGHMTAAAIAANSAASTLFLLVKSTAVGAASTASVLIGKTIGTGNIPLVKHYSRVMQRMFVVIGLASGLLLFLIRIPVMSLYDLSPEAMDMMDTFLVILSVVCVGMSYQMPTNNGIIRGGGNAMFVVRMDLVSIWMIVIPLSFVSY